MNLSDILITLAEQQYQAFQNEGLGIDMDTLGSICSCEDCRMEEGLSIYEN